MSLRHFAALPRRFAMAPAVQTQTRGLSSQGAIAVTRLRDALEEYRTKNYSRELRSRFAKDIVRAAMHTESDSAVALDGMQRVLMNIDMQHAISAEEMQTIFRDLGDSSGRIQADQMMKMI